MAEPHDDLPEGWSVPFRRPALIAIAIPFVLLAVLGLAGWVYSRTLRPETVFAVSRLPAPQLETQANVPANDPPVTPEPPAADQGIEAAKARVAAEGLPGWTGAKR